MKKIIILLILIFFVEIKLNPANSTLIKRDFISEEHITTSNLIYNPISKNLYYITPNGQVLIVSPNTKKILNRINLGKNDELYDYDTSSSVDEKTGVIYVSFNRTLYVLDGSSNIVKNKIHLINNPDKIIPKTGSSKIWIFYSDLGLLGVIDDVYRDFSKKNSIKFEKYVKRPKDIIYNPSLNQLYLINPELNFIYALDKSEKIVATLDYRKQIKLVENKKNKFDSVLGDGSLSEIPIGQLRSSLKEKIFSFDEESGRLFIPLKDSFLVLNTKNNVFEERIENLSPYKKIITTSGKILLLSEIGNTSYFALAIIDEKTKKIVDLSVLDKIENIAIDKENKKLYATVFYSRLNHSSLISVDFADENTKTYLKQFDRLIRDLNALIFSSKDFRIKNFYKEISVYIDGIKTLREKNNGDLSCVSFLGKYMEEVKSHLKRFISPCLSDYDTGRVCLSYYRLKEILEYLGALTVLDYDQDNFSDLCGSPKNNP